MYTFSTLRSTVYLNNSHCITDMNLKADKTAADILKKPENTLHDPFVGRL